jgi:hypothetical protein
MFLDIQHVYLHQPLLIRQIQVCTASCVDLANACMCFIYFIATCNDNFRYISCLRHRLLIQEL